MSDERELTDEERKRMERLRERCRQADREAAFLRAYQHVVDELGGDPKEIWMREIPLEDVEHEEE